MANTAKYAGGTYGTHERPSDALWLKDNDGWESADGEGRLPANVRRFDTAEEASRIARALWPGSHGPQGAISDHDGNYYRVITRRIAEV